MAKQTPETPREAKPPRAPRRSAKLEDIGKLEKKLRDRDVRIADIGEIADQIRDLMMEKPDTDIENLKPGEVQVFTNDGSLVKIEAILALVRGEDLGEWARARIGL